MTPTTEPLQTGISNRLATLPPGAFSYTLSQFIPPDKKGWSPEDNFAFVEALITKLVDDKGDTIELAPEITNWLRLIYRPTPQGQSQALREVFERAGYELDAPAADAFALLLNPPQVADYLAKTKNRVTGEAYIQKERKYARKRGAFQALAAEGPFEALEDEGQEIVDEPAAAQPAPQKRNPAAAARSSR